MFKTTNEQQSIFFKWCSKMGVSSFDLQLRIPVFNQDKFSSWKWLRPIKNISVGYFFLKLLAWCRHINAKGGDVFIRPHGDAKQSLLFLDDLPVKKAMALSEKYASCVICTSPNNTQVWLAITSKLKKEDRLRAQSYLKDLEYTDPGSVSGDHLGRLCGMKSYKRNCWVNLLKVSDAPKYTPILQDRISRPLGQRCVSFKTNVCSSESERDFGWVIGLFKSGLCEHEIYSKLFEKSSARDKKNPEQYTKRTVTKVSNLFHSGDLY